MRYLNSNGQSCKHSVRLSEHSIFVCEKIDAKISVFFFFSCLNTEMVRNYIRKTSRVDAERLRLAVIAVKKDGMKIRTAAMHFQVPRSTLQRHVKTPTKEPKHSRLVGIVWIFAFFSISFKSTIYVSCESVSF